MQEKLDFQLFAYSHPSDLEKQIAKWLDETRPSIETICDLGPGSLGVFFKRSKKRVKVKLLQFYFNNDLGPMVRTLIEKERIQEVSTVHLLSPGELLLFFEDEDPLIGRYA